MTKPLTLQQKIVLAGLQSWCTRTPPIVPKRWLESGWNNLALRRLVAKGLVDVHEKDDPDWYDLWHIDYRDTDGRRMNWTGSDDPSGR